MNPAGFSIPRNGFSPLETGVFKYEYLNALKTSACSTVSLLFHVPPQNRWKRQISLKISFFSQSCAVNCQKVKKLSFIGVFVLASCLSSFAQTSPDPSCPSIQVFGPAGIVQPNDIARYTAKVDAKGQKLDLTYLWSVSAGKVISGQGILGIEVRWPKRDSITVTIEVKGVPDGCPIRASETASIDFPPEPIKLAQFNGATFVGDKLELNKIVRTMNDNPNNQLYVYFAYKQEPAGKPAQERERHAVDYLAAATGDLSRITVVRIFDGVNLVQFWRVPPGADNPICRECDESVCPVISVTGPSGIWVPGEIIQFAVSLEGNVPPNVAYQWSISEGEIADGQGTANIAIRTKPSQSSLTATIEIKGLPKECPNVASETGGGLHDRTCRTPCR